MSFKNVPGVFIEEVSLLPPSVAGVETGIPAFIGYTQKVSTPQGISLVNRPTRITGLREYEEIFGKALPENDGLAVQITDFIDEKGNTLRSVMEAKFDSTKQRSRHLMYYALQLYFANGGGPCYIVSTGGFSAEGETVLTADLSNGLEAVANEDEPTMLVIPEAIYLGESDYFTLYNKALQQCADLKDRVTIIDVKQTPRSTDPAVPPVSTDSQLIVKDIQAEGFRKDAGGLVVDNLRFGAAYYPYLDTTIDYNYTGKEDKIDIIYKKTKPDGSDGGAVPGKKLADLKGSDNLTYEKAKAALSEVPLVMPPSPAIAGIYARVDADRGVWKAPANVGVAAISGPSLRVADADQQYMNIDPGSGKSVNAIRTITGRGTVVWGARTLDGNSNEWRYISVRRFFNFVEESIKKASYRFVFEPNDANTWVKMQAMIENFLTLQWRAGALQGAKPEQAFYVQVGLGKTMTAIDVLEGRIIVEIGLAVVRPAEFIILRFSHKLPEA